MSDEATALFETHRRYLRGVAYRMLGSVSDADDVVQEAFLRWHATDTSAVAEPRAFLLRLLLRAPDGLESLTLEIKGDHITAIYLVRNPDKLRHLA